MVPAASTVVGAPEITPVELLIDSPAGREGAQTSTRGCPVKVGVCVVSSPLVSSMVVAP